MLRTEEEMGGISTGIPSLIDGSSCFRDAVAMIARGECPSTLLLAVVDISTTRDRWRLDAHTDGDLAVAELDQALRSIAQAMKLWRHPDAPAADRIARK